MTILQGKLMKYYQIKPSKTLSAYVKYFWIGEAAASTENCFTHFSIATSAPKLIFHYKGQFSEIAANGQLTRSFTSGIQGQSKTHARFISPENVGILGVEFFPYAVPVLFSMPASALTNQFIDITSFCGSKGNELEERIFSASTNQERLHMAAGFLESLVKRPVNPHIVNAVQSIDKLKGLVDMDTLLKNVPLSQRQFERLFKEITGFSPKLYTRIARFETAVNDFRRKASFAEIALDAGYFDQAHFNHDFMEFTGLKPNAYLKVIDRVPVPSC
ncbi:Helix-turn-helix domain-containing protein [Chitinophaga rupis]|uniref:Helix-turn-helix domain-containing protein n=1 Tax=Chitinophaga rupis TaxID=573321 RepID=A0A1H8F7C4_9BACT|nr:helix-turn-helix domain-containing protein [Chitinophaga rupis]SEN27801.1 Helix-turn-helix domain-containing protein [Chitinophaga rupis]